MELTRCPNCGVNLYEPEEDFDAKGKKFHPVRKSLGERLDGFFHRVTKKPYKADELFGAAIRQAELFDDLVRKAGDREAAERLVEFERRQSPQGNRIRWIQSAIERWDRDNRVKGGQ